MVSDVHNAKCSNKHNTYAYPPNVYNGMRERIALSGMWRWQGSSFRWRAHYGIFKAISVMLIMLRCRFTLGGKTLGGKLLYGLVKHLINRCVIIVY